MEKHRHLFLRDLVFCSVVGICVGVFHIAAWYVSDPADPYAVFPVSSRSVMQWDETHIYAFQVMQDARYGLGSPLDNRPHREWAGQIYVDGLFPRTFFLIAFLLSGSLAGVFVAADFILPALAALAGVRWLRLYRMFQWEPALAYMLIAPCVLLNGNDLRLGMHEMPLRTWIPQAVLVMIFLVFWSLERLRQRPAVVNGVICGLAVVAAIYTYPYLAIFVLSFGIILFIGVYWTEPGHLKPYGRAIAAALLVMVPASALFFWFHKVQSNLPSYGDFLDRMGREMTHRILWKESLVVILAGIVPTIYYMYVCRHSAGRSGRRLALILLSAYLALLGCVNLQIITGYYVQPQHFRTVILGQIFWLPWVLCVGELLRLHGTRSTTLPRRKVARIVSALGTVGVLLFGFSLSVWRGIRHAGGGKELAEFKQVLTAAEKLGGADASIAFSDTGSNYVAPVYAPILLFVPNYYSGIRTQDIEDRVIVLQKMMGIQHVERQWAAFVHNYHAINRKYCPIFRREIERMQTKLAMATDVALLRHRLPIFFIIGPSLEHRSGFRHLLTARLLEVGYREVFRSTTGLFCLFLRSCGSSPA